MEGFQINNGNKNKNVYRLSPSVICDISPVVTEYICRRDILECFLQVIKVILDNFNISFGTESFAIIRNTLCHIMTVHEIIQPIDTYRKMKK